MIVPASAAPAVRLKTVLASATASRNVSVARRAAAVRCWLMRVLGVLLGIVALSCSHMGFAAGRVRASHAPLKWREPGLGAGIVRSGTPAYRAVRRGLPRTVGGQQSEGDGDGR